MDNFVALLSIDEVAQFLGVSRKSVYRWVKLRKIPFIRLERHLRFQPEAVIEHFKSKSQEVAVPCFQSDLLLQTAKGRRDSRSLKIGENKAAGSYPEKG